MFRRERHRATPAGPADVARVRRHRPRRGERPRRSCSARALDRPDLYRARRRAWSAPRSTTCAGSGPSTARAAGRAATAPAPASRDGRADAPATGGRGSTRTSSVGAALAMRHREVAAESRPRRAGRLADGSARRAAALGRAGGVRGLGGRPLRALPAVGGGGHDRAGAARHARPRRRLPDAVEHAVERAVASTCDTGRRRGPDSTGRADPIRSRRRDAAAREAHAARAGEQL